MPRWRDPFFASPAARLAAVNQSSLGLAPLFPTEPLGPPRLVCSCDRCISPHILPELMKTPPVRLTPGHLTQYFGGASAVEVSQSKEDQQEALAIYLRVLQILAEAVIADASQERRYHRTAAFIEPDYEIATLFRTGFAEALPTQTHATLSAHLRLLTEAATGGLSHRLTDVIGHWGRFDAPGLIRWLEALASGPPRRALFFWVGLGRGDANSPRGRQMGGYSEFEHMFPMPRPEARAALVTALARPETGQLFQRYAMAAREEEWFDFLARLTAWRDNTLSVAATRPAPHWHALDQPLPPLG